MQIAAIVLAAGASRRLGQPKQLLRIGGEALLERALGMAAGAGAQPVLAVIGANFAGICAGVSFGSSIPIYNDQWHLGLSTSIRAGMHELEARSPECAGVLLMNCDQPRLTTGHLRVLIDLFAAQAEPSMIASSYADTLGTPAIFPRAAFARLRSLRGDKGARSLLVNPNCPLMSVPFEGGEVDIDLPDDLAALVPDS